jgi:hypothetical protein
MSWTATSKCFYCGNSINRGKQTYVYAVIEHRYKHGGCRTSDRNFHESCFEKFEESGGRPWNPDTAYAVLKWEPVSPGETSAA